MAFLLDTDVVIYLRDGNDAIWQRARELDPPLAISATTRIELESGVYRDRQWTKILRQSLDAILGQVTTLDFGRAEIEAYRGNQLDNRCPPKKSILPATQFRSRDSHRFTAPHEHDLRIGLNCGLAGKCCCTVHCSE